MLSNMRCCFAPTSALVHRDGARLLRHLGSAVGATDSEDSEAAPKSRLPHTPVLLRQVLAQFEGLRLTTFVDCTLGAGGHASEIVKAHPELCNFVGFDADSIAIAEARKKLDGCCPKSLRLEIINSNFRNLRPVLEQLDLAKDGVDGILMDLGVSSMQLDAPGRGFSYHLDGPLDMRMDLREEETAMTILNEWPEDEIARILRDYGEEKRWKFLARRIIDARSSGGVSTTADLVKLIGGRYYAGKNQKLKHPAMRTFQALRIAVNDELKALETTLSQALSCLNAGGRLAVISFHSLEDRIVKHHFLNVSSRRDRPLSTLGQDVAEHLEFELMTKRPVVCDEEERETNPRSRSAKLRVIQRKPSPSREPL